LRARPVDTPFPTRPRAHPLAGRAVPLAVSAPRERVHDPERGLARG